MKPASSRISSRKHLKAVVASVAAFAVVSAFGFTGCASQQKTLEKGSEAASHVTEEVKASDIVVSQSGFTPIDATSTDAEGNPVPATEYQYVFEVSNSNTGYVAKDVPFNVVGLDGDGNSVFVSGASCQYLYPDVPTVVTGSATVRTATDDSQPAATVSELQIEPIMTSTEWLENQLTKSDFDSMFSVSNVEATPVEVTDEGVFSSGSSIEVTATVTGKLEDASKIYRSTDFEDTIEATVVAVFTNEDGEMMFGSQATSILIDQQTLDDLRNNPGFRNVSIRLPFAAKYVDVQLYVMPGI